VVSGAAQKMEGEKLTMDNCQLPTVHCPLGYKRTELGVIPEDWEVKKLGEITLLMTNGFVGTATQHYVENENGILYIQGYNVEANAFNLHGIKYVNRAFHKAHMKSCLRAGDLLTVQTGDVGVTTVVTEELAGSNCHALIISRFDKHAFPRYVSHYLNSEYGRSRLKLIETGTTMKHLNVGDMLQFVIPMPPIPEQRAIAEALSDVDGWVASLDALIAKKRDLKTATMQQLLTGHTRLSGFTGEWERKKLGDVVEIKKGQLITEKTAVQGDVPVIAGGLKPSYYHNQPNRKPNVVTISASGASAGFVSFHPYAIFASDCSTIEQSNAYDVKFIFFALQSRQAEIYKLQTGGAQPHVYPEHIRDLHVALPTTIEEQTAIATILSDMDAEIATLEAEREKASAIKQGMMQELLTGKTRLV
jgi:type I restriction enzyme, S subunit